MSRQVVFILGLSRCGSTMLDVLLGGLDRVVGIGEAYDLVTNVRNWLHRPDEATCSCGQTMGQCPFWGPTAEIIRRIPAEDTAARYEAVYRSFGEFFGPDAVAVDSSKRADARATLSAVPGLDIKTVYLIRDARAWMISLIDNLKRLQAYYLTDMIRTYGWRRPKGYLDRIPLRVLIQWYLANRRLQRFLRDEQIDHFQLGYEELALRPAAMLEMIYQYTGLDPAAGVPEASRSQSHAILGNPHAPERVKRLGVVYDNRWFRRREWVWATALAPSIMAYNTREVYRHLTRPLPR